MSLATINIQDFIERIAEIFEADTTIFPPETTGESLINGVVRNEPAIIQSVPDEILPYIIVFESKQPIRFIKKVGRDTRDVEGGSLYEVEIYCVVVTDNELTTEEAQIDIHTITAAMRNAVARNLRLADPADLTQDPLCSTHSRFEIPYILKGEVAPSMKAMNVVIRAQVYVSPRSV